jgi:hypothetical protein
VGQASDDRAGVVEAVEAEVVAALERLTRAELTGVLARVARAPSINLPLSQLPKWGPAWGPAPWTDALVAYLNEALALDRGAVSALLLHRAECSEALADHPTVQCWGGAETGAGVPAVSVLGLLNGFCGLVGGAGPRATWGPVSAEVATAGTREWVEAVARTNPDPAADPPDGPRAVRSRDISANQLAGEADRGQ